MHLLRGRVGDKRLRALIGAYLRAPMQESDGSKVKRWKGTPQGGPLSPLLADIYLDPLDKELEKRGLRLLRPAPRASPLRCAAGLPHGRLFAPLTVRYADDIAIFAGSRRSAERIYQGVVAWIEKHLKVEVNREKSGVGPSGGSSLLGFRILEDGRVGVSPKAVEKLKDRVRQMWNARQNLTSVQLRDRWRRYIRGWRNCLRLADWRREVVDISGWI
jgi:RNA-directed DNA polymerase